MNEQERLAFLATNYYGLQGLRFAPVFGLLIASHWFAPSGLGSRAARIGLGLGFLVTCVAWFWLFHRFYERHYGRVVTTPFDDRPIDRTKWFFLLVFPLAYCLRRFGGITTSAALYLPFYIFCRGLARSNVAIRRSYHLAAAAFLLVVILQATILTMPGHQFFQNFEWPLIGAACLMLCILDHLVLIECFRYRPVEINA
jgi:hypothetical protein